MRFLLLILLVLPMTATATGKKIKNDLKGTCWATKEKGSCNFELSFTTKKKGTLRVNRSSLMDVKYKIVGKGKVKLTIFYRGKQTADRLTEYRFECKQKKLILSDHRGSTVFYRK